jgi:hypothetical protein
MISEAKAKAVRKAGEKHHDSDAFEETKRNANPVPKKNHEQAKESGPARVQGARQNIHGSSTNTESPFLTPLKKGKTDGGNNK